MLVELNLITELPL